MLVGKRQPFASLQVMQGRDLRTVQELPGHTGIRPTELSAHLNESYLAAAEIDLIPVDLGD